MYQQSYKIFSVTENHWQYSSGINQTLLIFIRCFFHLPKDKWQSSASFTSISVKWYQSIAVRKFCWNTENWSSLVTLVIFNLEKIHFWINSFGNKITLCLRVNFVLTCSSHTLVVKIWSFKFCNKERLSLILILSSCFMLHVIVVILMQFSFSVTYQILIACKQMGLKHRWSDKLSVLLYNLIKNYCDDTS